MIALQSLYEFDFRQRLGDDTASLDDVVKRNLERYADKVSDQAFVEKLVSGIHRDAKLLDQEIQTLATEWPLERIALVDHEILRIGVFELKNLGDVPPKVAINEAVELAKAFGSENSSRFVNGVLGAFWRAANGEEANEKTK
jgi:N utilization substance protein B